MFHVFLNHYSSMSGQLLSKISTELLWESICWDVYPKIMWGTVYSVDTLDKGMSCSEQDRTGWNWMTWGFLTLLRTKHHLKLREIALFNILFLEILYLVFLGCSWPWVISSAGSEMMDNGRPLYVLSTSFAFSAPFLFILTHSLVLPQSYT